MIAGVRARFPSGGPVSVTVVGSLNEDVLVAVGRLPGRGETVIGRDATLAPGGKGANQAAAAGRLGPGVHMVGRVGQDPAGDRQLAALADSRVNVGRVHRSPGVPTGSATIAVEDGTGENLIVVVPGCERRADPGGRRRGLGAPGDRAAAAARGADGHGVGRCPGGHRHGRPDPGSPAAAAAGAARPRGRPGAQRARARAAGRRRARRAPAGRTGRARPLGGRPAPSSSRWAPAGRWSCRSTARRCCRLHRRWRRWTRPARGTASAVPWPRRWPVGHRCPTRCATRSPPPPCPPPARARAGPSPTTPRSGRLFPQVPAAVPVD